MKINNTFERLIISRNEDIHDEDSEVILGVEISTENHDVCEVYKTSAGEIRVKLWPKDITSTKDFHDFKLNEFMEALHAANEELS